MKPRVFIGSSTEGLSVAYAVQTNLQYACEPTVWSHGVFQLTKPGLSSLIDALSNFDFAVFCITPDDEVNLRGEGRRVVRDNVIFEFGLFLGRLGPDRVFFVVPRDMADLHLPSDLLGVTPATYDAHRKDGNLGAALGPACHAIGTMITRPELNRTALGRSVPWAEIESDDEVSEPSRFEPAVHKRIDDVRAAARDHIIVQIEKSGRLGSVPLPGPLRGLELWDLFSAASMMSVIFDVNALSSLILAEKKADDGDGARGRSVEQAVGRT